MFTTVLICTSINVVILLVIYQLFKRKIEKAVSSSELVDNVRREVDALVVELNHTTERNLSLIEESIGRLNKMLKDADNRIVALKRRDAPSGEIDAYEALGKVRRAPVMPNAEPTIKEKVLEMAGEGFENTVIAGRLGLPLGEVDLIISLETTRGGIES